MAWNLIAPNTWSNSKSPYLIKFDSITNSFIVEDIDGKNFIPLDDIFNNPAFPADFSNIPVLGKHFRTEGANTPATPGFSFQGDINTGFFRKSEDTVGFSAGGAQYGEFGVGYGGFTGNIIQVVQEQSNTRYAVSNGNFVQASDGVSITPKYTNSKFLIIYICSMNNNGNNGYDFARKIGSGSIVFNISGKSWGINSSAHATTWNVLNLMFLDSPTLSNLDPITYYLCTKTSGTGTTTMNMGSNSEFAPFIIAEVQQ